MATTNPVSITAPEGVPYIDITREFDAPVSAVFAAHSNPELVKQWLGPNGYEMEIDEYEFVSGGRYKYVHRNPEGEEFRFNGVFHVVRENDFAIQTFEYEGFPDVVSIESRNASASIRCRDQRHINLLSGSASAFFASKSDDC